MFAYPCTVPLENYPKLAVPKMGNFYPKMVRQEMGKKGLSILNYRGLLLRSQFWPVKTKNPGDDTRGFV